MCETHFKHRSLYNHTKVARGQDGIDNEFNRSSAGEAEYVTMCALCESGERDGTRPLRPQCFTV